MLNRENCDFTKDLATKNLTSKAYNQNVHVTAKLFFSPSDSYNDLYGLKFHREIRSEFLPNLTLRG